MSDKLQDFLEEGQVEVIDTQSEETEAPIPAAPNKPKRRKKRRLKPWARVVKWIGISILAFLLVVVLAFLTIFYSPFFPTLRDRYILMTYKTSNPWLCTTFFTQEQIDAAFERNSVVAPEGETDPDLVAPGGNGEGEGNDEPTPDPITFSTSEKYQGKVIFEENGVQILEFSGKNPGGGKYTARLIQVLDPSRVFLGLTNNFVEPNTPDATGFSGKGQTIGEFIDTNNAICGINAGCWNDPKGIGSGGLPKDIIIKDGVIKQYDNLERHNIIGINKDNVLVLGNFSNEEIIANNIRDGIAWEPFLIVNGKKAEASGVAGGYDPRSAIGQRADGAILLLVVDGGATYLTRGIDGVNFEFLMDVMWEFGAVNASNIDGGTSSSMGLKVDGKGKIINTVCNSEIAHRGRYLNTTWLVKDVPADAQ
ncbi:MAG: phosphodiester glycosidase family protein [Clostridia bacterium]|nr:phosphodiester glycosidase family protein [Clostridia bacterium]